VTFKVESNTTIVCYCWTESTAGWQQLWRSYRHFQSQCLGAPPHFVQTHGVHVATNYVFPLPTTENCIFLTGRA
jgi:hypothetical protein